MLSTWLNFGGILWETFLTKISNVFPQSIYYFSAKNFKCVFPQSIYYFSAKNGSIASKQKANVWIER